MNHFFLKLLNMSFAAGLLVPVVLVLRLVLTKAPKWTRCVLWAFVALRLILPVEIASPLSLFNALGRQENGSVEYFYAAGGSEKPLVSFDTFRFDGAAAPEDTVISFSNGSPPLVRHEATRYLPPLVTAWLIGVGLMLLYLLWSYMRLRRRVGASAPLDDRVRICDSIDAPFILGLFRPRVYIPSTLSEPQLSHVLAHERAHLARRDHWWKPLGFVLLAVHWFNPLLWLGYYLLCRDIELACDEKVLNTLDSDARTDYSQALLDLSRPRVIAACPLAFGETGVKTRIKAALNYKKPAFWLILAAVLLCAVAAVSFLTNPVRSDSPEAPPEGRIEEQSDAQQTPAANDPLLTVRSGGQSVDAFPITRWSENGNLSADGVPLEYAVPDHGMDIPTLIYDGVISVTARPGAELDEKEVLVFTEAMKPVFTAVERVGLDGLLSLEPGTYYCALPVTCRDEDGASCDDCVFRLVIPEPSDDSGVPADIRAFLDAVPDAEPEIPTAYPDTLAEHQFVVTDPEWRIYNKAVWDDFYASVQAGTPADVVLAVFENESDMMVYYLRYDRNRILMVRDSSRHSFFPQSDYFCNTYSYVQELDWNDLQSVILSDEPYADYQEYVDSLYQVPEKVPYLAMVWRTVATQRPGDTLPITRLALLKFVDIGISNRAYVLNVQENRPEGESDRQLIETLKQEIGILQAFREEVEQNVTEQNVMDYWNRLWNDILKVDMPLGYDYPG